MIKTFKKHDVRLDNRKKSSSIASDFFKADFLGFGEAYVCALPHCASPVMYWKGEDVDCVTSGVLTSVGVPFFRCGEINLGTGT